MTERFFGSGKPWEETARYAQAARVEGGVIFVSGQVGIDAKGAIVARGDLAAQARQAFENIHDLLIAGGCDWQDLVKLTYYVLDMSQWEKVADVRRAMLGELRTVSTTVEVSRLHHEDYLIEIEAVAAPTDWTSDA